MADIKVYQSRFTKAISSYEDSRAGVQTSRQQNLSRRTCYSILQFLKIDLETVIDTGDIDEKQAKELCGEIQQYCEESLPLQQIREPISTLYLMGEAIRIFAAWMNLVNFALVLSLPVIIFTPIEDFLVEKGLVKNCRLPSVWIRRCAAFYMIISSGVTVKIDGWDHWESVNEDTPTILLFSHASTMDAFLLMAALPTRGQVMAKKELFYIPWFSWLLIAFGGVPVDRKRRSRAIESLEAAALGLSRGDCITLAPEGTRSVTGHLQEFKKGAFHLTEQLGAQIMPMVIFGAFEMYPPGRSMSLSGTVFVHFLQCVQGKALDRVALSNRVRHDMLEAILKCPENICRRLTVWERILQATLLMITYTLNAVGCYLLWRRFFSTRGTFDVLSALLWFLLISVIITAVLYYYVAYIRNKVRKHDVQSKSKMS